MAGANESNLGTGVISFSSAGLGDAISGIRTANEDYRAKYQELKAYFEGDLKEAVQGDFYNGMKAAFDNNKAGMENIYNYVDELLAQLSTQTAKGEDLATDKSSELKNMNLV